MNWDRLEELLERALARPSDEREAFVREVASGDSQLQSILQSMVEHSDAGERLFQELGEDLPRPLAADGPEGGPLEGTTVGRYQVGARVGVGGMGEVYSAWDPTLQRRVALKFLSTRQDRGGGLLLEEARAVAALEHPNICSIFEIGETEEGRTFLAMPFYEGPTLHALLRQEGPLPMEEVRTLGAQIAGGLAAAHECSIVHRDIKPSNILVARGGVVKILDFGIASGPRDVSGSLRERGTLAYLSPERMRSEDGGAAGDIWSLGIVLHEMITGTSPIRRPDGAETVRRLRAGEAPALELLAEVAPPALRELIERCLAPEPRSRPSAEAVKGELERVRFPSEPIPTATGSSRPAAALPSEEPTRSGGGRSRWGHLAMTGLAAALALTVPFWSSLAPDGGGAGLELTSVNIPRPVPSGSWIDVSEESASLVSMGSRNGPSQRISLHDGSAVRLANAAKDPALSPDGSRTAFIHDGLIWIADRDVPWLTPVSDQLDFQVAGLDWIDDDRLAIGSVGRRGLFELRLDPDGGVGTLRNVAVPDPAEDQREFFHPAWLPGGTSVLVVVRYTAGVRFPTPAVIDLETGEVRSLSTQGRSPQYSDGHVFYTRSGRMWAVPFDPTTMTETGPPVRLPVEAHYKGMDAQFAVDGQLMAVIRTLSQTESVLEADRNGERRELPVKDQTITLMRYSPDGKTVLLGLQGGYPSLMAADRVTRVAETFLPETVAQAPVWASTGGSVFFSGVEARIYEAPFPEGGEPVRVADAVGLLRAVGPEDDWIVYRPLGSSTHVALRRSDGTEVALPFAGLPSFSPGGDYIAFDVREGTDPRLVTPSVWVLPFPGLGEPIRISIASGYSPVWTRAGDEILYRSDEGIVAVKVRTEPEFTVLGSELVISDPYSHYAGWDVHPDGSPFVFVEHLESEITVEIIRWKELLEGARAEAELSDGNGSEAVPGG